MHAAHGRTYRRTSGALALACLLCAAAPSLAGAAPGDLDSTFSGDGLLTSDLGRGDSRAAAVVVQPDGRIVAVGQRADRHTGPGSLSDFAIARYNADGSPDATFSGDGRQATSVSPALDQAAAVALQTDGRIVVAGRAGGNDSDFAVARYTSDGSLDTSFSADGMQTIDFGDVSEAAGVAVQPDGAIVIAGTVGTGPDSDFALARLNADGTPDASFGDQGIATTDVDVSDRAAAVVLQPDGAIVVAGSAAMSTGFTSDDNLFAVVRYADDGVVDATFGDAGIRTAVVGSSYGGWAAAAALDGDGRIVVVGRTSYSQIAVVRLDGGGDLDATFSDDGLALTADAGGDGVVTDPDDNTITVLARAMYSGAMLVRYAENGTPDSSLDSDGTQPVAEVATPGGLALQPDGRIVAVGSAGRYAASHDFVVVRRNADGSADGSFAGDGSQTTEFAGAGGDEAAALAIGPDGSIVAVGSSDNDSDFATVGVGDLVIARSDAAGVPSATFSGDGVATDDRVAGASGVALQSDGKIVAVGRSGAGFGVVRYGAGGTPDPGFGSAGLQRTEFGGSSGRATAVTLAPGGKIVVVGSGSSVPNMLAYDVAVARYDASGALDTSFSGDGRQLVDIGATDSARAVAMTDDGKIVVAGSTGTYNATASDVAVLRLNDDGSPDTSFSNDGFQTIDFGGVDFGTAVTLQPDGRIVVAGTARDGALSDVAIARLNTDGSLDASFDGDGKQATDFGEGADGAAGVVVSADGTIVVAGFAEGDARDFAIARYDAGGSLDATFSGDGKQLTDFADSNDRALAIALAPGGAVIAAGGATVATSPDFAFARYDNASATVDTTPPAETPPPAAADPPAETTPAAAAETPPATAPPAAPVPPPAAAPDGTAPTATVSAARSQRLRASFAAVVRCLDEACVATVRATVRIGGATTVLRQVSHPIAKGAKATFALRLPRALQARIRRALRRQRAVSVALRVTVSDAAGNDRVVRPARSTRLTL